MYETSVCVCVLSPDVCREQLCCGRARAKGSFDSCFCAGGDGDGDGDELVVMATVVLMTVLMM